MLSKLAWAQKPHHIFSFERTSIGLALLHMLSLEARQHIREEPEGRIYGVSN